MRRRAVTTAMTLLLSGAVLSSPAVADTGCGRDGKEQCPEGEAKDDGFEFTDEDTSTDPVQGVPTGGGGAPLPVIVTVKTHVPVCSGNRVEGGLDALCGAATLSCPEEGEIRMWVYTRRVNRITGQAVSDWELVREPATVCVGPEEEAVDPIVLITRQIGSEFVRRTVLKGVAEVSPRPDTLINIPTRFETAAPASYPISFELLGQQVVITATAESWTWYFGDGQSATTTAKGTRGRVEHVYRSDGGKQAHVVISWSGTYTVNGRDMGAITGRATTIGDPVAVEVKQARSTLVAD